MPLTNRHGLPDFIVDAVTNDKYDKGESDITVTQLIGPPQIRYLKSRHESDEDVSEKLYSLDGQSLHFVIERACQDKDHLASEQRLYLDRGGKRIGGQFDILDARKRELFDLKRVSVYAKDGKIEWEQQLNLLKLLVEEGVVRFCGELKKFGGVVDKLTIIPFFRDWMRSKRNQYQYPQAQVVPIDIAIWPREKTLAYLDERLALHAMDPPPPCTDEERWMQPGVFAVMKDGRKTAVKLHEKFEDADRHRVELGAKHTVVQRPTQYKRCEDYCPVADHCPQWAAIKAEAPF